MNSLYTDNHKQVLIKTAKDAEEDLHSLPRLNQSSETKIVYYLEIKPW